MSGTPANVSLAWRDDVLLFGIGPRPIGVDIERIGPALEPPWNVLAPEERDALTVIDNPAVRHDAFLRIWTVKEAALKALGTGFAQEPSALSVSFTDGKPRLMQEGKALAASEVRVESFGEGPNRFLWACVVL